MVHFGFKMVLRIVNDPGSRGAYRARYRFARIPIPGSTWRLTRSDRVSREVVCYPGYSVSHSILLRLPRNQTITTSAPKLV